MNVKKKISSLTFINVNETSNLDVVNVRSSINIFFYLKKVVFNFLTADAHFLYDNRNRTTSNRINIKSQESVYFCDFDSDTCNAVLRNNVTTWSEFRFVIKANVGTPAYTVTDYSSISKMFYIKCYYSCLYCIYIILFKLINISTANCAYVFFNDIRL